MDREDGWEYSSYHRWNAASRSRDWKEGFRQGKDHGKSKRCPPSHHNNINQTDSLPQIKKIKYLIQNFQTTTFQLKHVPPEVGSCLTNSPSEQPRPFLMFLHLCTILFRLLFPPLSPSTPLFISMQPLIQSRFRIRMRKGLDIDVLCINQCFRHFNYVLHQEVHHICHQHAFKRGGRGEGGSGRGEDLRRKIHG